ncbi:Serine/threonine-protein phosphatase 2A activator 1 [Ciborinia camelliae]|nr:Serine/threonine-protein phosphatase 2A activator 1 [Ciborinia camelliae]
MASQQNIPNSASEVPSSRNLPILDPSQPHTFIKPIKRIHEGHDVPHFLISKAYADIGVFVMQLNIAMCPRKPSEIGQEPQTWTLDSSVELSEPVKKLQELLENIDAIIDEAPPDTGPRRFGNVSFRKWYDILETRAKDLLKQYLPADVLGFGGSSPDDEVSALDELSSYLLGGFGSAQRLDYGTGHELSFLAFLGCIWKLGGFTKTTSNGGELERSIVMGIIEPYLRVIRRLILTYTLEPAGSHGVWGLDDHSFLPYIFGSSQYCPAINNNEAMPVEGSLPEAPNPGDVAKKMTVNRERKNNMYFSAIGFINDVKTGPFWEHSPILFDISGVRSGWGKINKGMIKMYNAEVLSKFPVVQHFPFGSLFSWDQDPHAVSAPQTVHTANQPTGSGGTPTSRPPPQEGTRAPWANASQTQGMPSTTAPWANPTAGVMPSTRRNIPLTSSTAPTRSTPLPGPTPTTRPAWPNSSNAPPTSSSSNASQTDNGPTRAPWAK